MSPSLNVHSINNSVGYWIGLEVGVASFQT